MADIRKNLERFIRQQVFRNRDNPLEKFVLRSAGVGNRGNEVDTIHVPPDLNSENIGALVDEIAMRAQTDADGLGSKLQRYILVALEVGARDGARFPFRLRGEGDDGDGEDGDELVPTEKGVSSQLMRHNEAMMRMFVMSNNALIGGLAKRLESTEKLLDTMVTQRHHDLATIEASKSEAHDRDVQMLLTSGQEDRKNEMFKKLELLLPLIVNKVAGTSVLPVKGGDIFTNLANSLTPEQLQQIAPFLTQEQQVLLLTLLKAAREPAAAKPPNGAVS